MTDRTEGTPDAAPVPRRRGTLRKGDLREQAILDGARRLLKTHPLERLTIDALAREAGLSRSSFYVYFDSKQAVLSAMLTGLATQVVTLADRGWLSATGPQHALLRETMVTVVALWRDHGPLLRQALLVEDPDPALSAFRTRVRQGYVARAGARIQRDRDLGLCPPGPPTAEHLAAMTYDVELTTLVASTLGPDATTGPAADAYLVDALTAIRLRMIYGIVPDDTGPGGPA